MKEDTMEITRDIAQKVLTTVDAGLVAGLGKPEPGQMCVEAAVCYALGLPHADNPPCAAPTLQSLKIALNDAAWSSAKSRARGLRRLAVAQLGSAGTLDEIEFVRRVALMTVQQIVPRSLRTVVKMAPQMPEFQTLEAAALACAGACDLTAAGRAAGWAGEAAGSAAEDAELAFFAEQVVQILIAMNAPGCQWLDLSLDP